MNGTTLRCGNCKNWLGESPVALVYIEHVPKWLSTDTPPVEVSPPRDLRLCKGCERVNVFIPKSSLTGEGAAA